MSLRCADTFWKGKGLKRRCTLSGIYKTLKEIRISGYDVILFCQKNKGHVCPKNSANITPDDPKTI
jgi:hypothetical protein